MLSVEQSGRPSEVERDEARQHSQPSDTIVRDLISQHLATIDGFSNLPIGTPQRPHKSPALLDPPHCVGIEH